MSNTDSLSLAPDALVRAGISTGEGVAKPALSSSAAADHIVYGAWGDTPGRSLFISYAFRATGSVPGLGDASFTPFNAAQMAAAQKALTAWSDVADIHFNRVDDGSGYSNNATILFGNFTTASASDSESGFTYLPGSMSPSSIDGDVWINGKYSYNKTPELGDFGAQVLVHEIGHSIGLTHPGNYDASDSSDPTYESNAAYFEDSRQYTVMSYFNEYATGGDFGIYYSAVPLIDDITAIQRLYGANMSAFADDTTYGFHSNTGREWFTATDSDSPMVFAVWDAGGKDTFDFSGFSDPQLIDLRAGDFSNVGGLTGNVAIAYGVTIENAIAGSGGDTVIGNTAANVLTGGVGEDTLYGEGGNDTLSGGAGNDTLDGGSGINHIDGGSGNNELLLPGKIGDYHSVVGADGWWNITGKGLTDTVENIESVLIRDPTNGLTTGSYSFQAFASATMSEGTAGYHLAGMSDFDGDGHADILWRNVNGALSTWQLSGDGAANQIRQNVFSAQIDTGWKIVETSDFTGDGRADILWRHENGTFSIWDASGEGAFQPGSYTDDSVGNQWQIAATGDLNGDGKSDLLWRNQDGSISTWLSTGRGFQENAFSHAAVGANWKIEGLGDFNGDGHADIMWRNDNGTISTWLGTSTGFAENSYAFGGVGTDWYIAGLADFNGDARDDILWRNDNGALSIWTSNGSGFDQSVYNDSGVGPDWRVAEVADFNHDGRADILWQNVNGSVSTWESNGSGFNESVANAWAPGGWSIVSHAIPL